LNLLMAKDGKTLKNTGPVTHMASSIEQHKTRYEALLESIRKRKAALEKTRRPGDLTI